MKFLVPNYSCLQNPWLGGYRPGSPFSLSSVLNWICWNPLPLKQNSWVCHWYWHSNNTWFTVFSLVIRRAYYSMLQNSVTDVLRKFNMQILTNFKLVLTCFKFCLNMETRINKAGKQPQIKLIHRPTHSLPDFMKALCKYLWAPFSVPLCWQSSGTVFPLPDSAVCKVF